MYLKNLNGLWFKALNLHTNEFTISENWWKDNGDIEKRTRFISANSNATP